MGTIFQTWRHGGAQFLAVQNAGAGSVHIVDAAGNNYGGWMTVAGFRAAQRAGDSLAAPIGRAILSVRSMAGDPTF